MCCSNKKHPHAYLYRRAKVRVRVIEEFVDQISFQQYMDDTKLEELEKAYKKEKDHNV